MGNRVLVGVLAAVDALVAAAVGLGAVLAPLTLLWVFGFGDEALWSALWPATARVWQLGHLVPVTVALPAEYAVTAGVAGDAATFTVSLAPLALTAFTALFAARSGLRAAAAGAPRTGVGTGAVVFAAVSTAVLVTTPNPIATVTPWQAVVLPVAVFLVPAALGALAGAWRSGDDGPLDRLRERLGPRWEAVPATAARGAAFVLAGLVAAGALAVAGLVVVRGGEVIALFQAAHIDPLGATVVTLGQLGYLPTLVAWAVAFIAGPGFAVGAGTAVGPGAVQLPLVPGIPMLGLVPQSSSPWLLLLGLVPVALAFAVGRRARRDLTTGAAPRAVAAVLMAVLAGAGAALVAACASGAIGPGALAAIGPSVIAVGLAVGVEVLVGAAVALLPPAPPDDADAPAAVEVGLDRELVLAREARRDAPIG